jgi:hypothetical protein
MICSPTPPDRREWIFALLKTISQCYPSSVGKWGVAHSAAFVQGMMQGQGSITPAIFPKRVFHVVRRGCWTSFGSRPVKENEPLLWKTQQDQRSCGWIRGPCSSM